MQRREFIGLLGGDAASPFALAARKDGLGEEPCARSSSAQGSQAAGASGSWCATYPDQGLNCGATWRAVTSTTQSCTFKDAWLLGLHAVSAFTHAFKRWTGKTPSQIRTTGAY
jgi:hypothetical protein